MKKDKPSSTAIFIANGIWWVTKQKNISIEVPELMKEFNFEIVKQINPKLFSLKTKIGKWLLTLKTSIMQKASINGFYLHYVLRKRCIEEFVRAGIHKGAKQIIILGAGFDTLSMRISKDFPNIQIIEIDHPNTQKLKHKAMENLIQTFENIHLIPLDLKQDTMQNLLLSNPYYDKSKSSIFIAEGLTMYLAENEIRDILKFIKEHSGLSSQFVFTYMEEQNKGNYQFKNASRIVNLWLRFKNEIFTWGIKETQLSTFLIQSGFQLLLNKSHTELRLDFLLEKNKNSPLAIGENIALAQLR